MKKIFAFSAVFSLCIAGTVFAQQKKSATPGKPLLQHHPSANKGPGFSTLSTTAPYTFSYFTDTYTNLTGSTSLNAGLTWDDPTFTVPLNFPFIMWNDTLTGLMTSGLGGWLEGTTAGPNSPFVANACDVVDRASDTVDWEGMPGSISPVSYITTGTPGSRILKVEWFNAGFYDDIYDDNISTDFVYFQIWLYEGSNNMEIRFGSSLITQPSLAYSGEPGAILCAGYYDNDSMFIYSLKGSAASPTAVLCNADTGYTTLTGDPASGIVYKFSWFHVGIDEFDAQDKLIDLYPNPVSTWASLMWRGASVPQNASVEVIDVMGRTVLDHQSRFDREGRMNLDLSPLEPGSYTIRIASEEKTVYKKLIKQ